MDVREFRERQDSLTALLVELEARLTVRETAKLSWRLPLELTDAVAVLLEFGESVEVVEQTLYDGLDKIGIFRTTCIQHDRESVLNILVEPTERSVREPHRPDADRECCAR